MSDLKQFERMVKKAGGDRPPRIDVAARVLATVESYRFRPAVSLSGGSLWSESPLLAFAGFSLAAAVLVGMLALPCWESVQDPLVAFCKPLSAFFE